MMWVVIMLLPSLAFTNVKAKDTLVLDIKKALEIALSENPTVKVANKEIQKKKYAQKGSYAALFPQVSFAADYNRTLKKQVMYMDGFDMGSTEIPADCQRRSLEKPKHLSCRCGIGYRTGTFFQNCYGQPGKERVLRRASCQRFIPRI